MKDNECYYLYDSMRGCRNKRSYKVECLYFIATESGR